MSQNPTPPFPPERLRQLAALDYARLPSPCYVVHLGRLEENCCLLADVAKRAGCKILLAQKGFAMPAAYPLIAKYLPGTTSSGLHEALLAHEFFHGEVHVYSVAYKDAELEHLLGFAHTLIFNSPAQWRRFREKVHAAPRRIEAGLRVNPEYSEVETDLYNPCAPCSRLGTPRSELEPGDLAGLDGLHFHTLCEQDSDALEHTVAAFEEKFSEYFPKLKWVNFGGGHHITRPGYDLDRLVRVVQNFRAKYKLEVYLEPGEAVALHTGVLVGTVLDLPRNTMPLAILDVSATAHMPDVLEMPYRPARPQRRRGGRIRAHLPPRRANLPRGRCYRRLFLSRATKNRRPGGLSRHGALHHGQDLDLQRRPAAQHCRLRSDRWRFPHHCALRL